MDDPLVVRSAQRRGNLPTNQNGVANRQRSVRQRRLQRFSLDELQHQKPHAIGLFEAVDGSDVRVVERRQQLGFAVEAGHSLGVLGKVLGKDLDGDIPIKVLIAGSIHVAHSARAKRFDDHVMTEGLADQYDGFRRQISMRVL